MKNLKWALVPGTLIVILAVLMAIRIGMVKRRSTVWEGTGCIVGPYDPSERTYLLAITVVTALLLATAVAMALLAKTAVFRVLMVVLTIPVLMFAISYLGFVWTGGEETNRPGHFSDCHVG